MAHNYIDYHVHLQYGIQEPYCTTKWPVEFVLYVQGLVLSFLQSWPKLWMAPK